MRAARASAVVFLVGVATLGAGCSSSERGADASAGAAEPSPATSSKEPAPEPDAASPDAASADAGASVPVGRTDGCKEGMIRVEGEYCPAVVEECLEEHPEYQNRGDRTVSERCLRFKSPSVCVSKKTKHVDFCMDRYEWPNKVGEIPRVLTSWRQAVDFCKADNKRLCTEDEFNFACEGPEMLPYVYGFTRDPSVCTIDLDYRYPDHSKVLPHYDTCLETPWCAEELHRLDQRKRIGEVTTCVSWAGVYDLNGNVNEWVEIPNQKPPNRSGLKGGWWGPVRGRCRPTVTFHKEEDYGYEVGFRCCDDATN